MQPKSILASTPFLIINKTLLFNLGLDASLILSDLVQKEQYFISNNKLVNGYFFNTVNNISCSTSLSYYQIKQALSVLSKWGIIKVDRKGVPAKLHFKLFKDKILKILKSSSEKIEELECKNINNLSDNNFNYINKNKEIKINNKNKYKFNGDFELEVRRLPNKEYHQEFIDYWTEENNTGKQRWMLEKTWNTQLRLRRWANNNFSKSKSNMPDFYDMAYINRIKEDQAQIDKFHKHLIENCGYKRKETLTGHIKWIKK